MLNKEQFLKQYPNYGYNNQIDTIRETEFPQLNNTVYFDNAGTTIPSKYQLNKNFSTLTENILINPHSISTNNTRDYISEVRSTILKYLNLDNNQYSVIFTSSATTGIKTIQDLLLSAHNKNIFINEFCYTIDNHNSILGLRNLFISNNIKVSVVTGDTLQCCCNYSDSFENFSSNNNNNGINTSEDSNIDSTRINLFAFPAESNFSSKKYNLSEICHHVKENKIGHSKTGKWLVLLDIAKAISTCKLDLSSVKFDFAVCSFYKLFGFPTGIGAIILNNSVISLLNTNNMYWGGGNVEIALSTLNYQVYRQENIWNRLEAGTIPFQLILSLIPGFEFINKLSISNIEYHINSMVDYLFHRMCQMKYSNGNPLVRFYCRDSTDIDKFGSILTFNILKYNGEIIGYNEVQYLALNICNIYLRTGCFCNSGACQYYLNMSVEELKESHAQGHKCFDDKALFNSKATGAIRISLGYMNTFEDCNIWLSFLYLYFLHKPSFLTFKGDEIPTNQNIGFLRHISLFPIKSCSYFLTNSWPLGPLGLLYDREWSIIDSIKKSAVNQKDFPQLALVKPSIDLEQRVLKIDAPEMPSLKLSLDHDSNSIETTITVCGSERLTHKASNEASVWFSKYLKHSVFLVRTIPQTGYFKNEAPYLLISNTSLKVLNDAVLESNPKEEEMSPFRFRPNFVIDNIEAFIEDKIRAISIGSIKFEVLSSCVRCTQININPDTATSNTKIYKYLASSRRTPDNKITFGILLANPNINYANNKYILSIGDTITCSY